jgi:ABC-type Fe3+-hydroxamate transport system substrate-binding protein
MPVYTDQLNRKLDLSSTPRRIISLVPSQTEFLYDIGLRDEVVGITKFCVHPQEWFRSKPRIGGTKKYDFEKIRALQPDLIIGNKEENEKEQIEELMKEFNVWMSDIVNLKDALNMMVMLGVLLKKDQQATEIKLRTEYAFQQFKASAPFVNMRCAYFIWRAPYMVAGENTFINEMLKYCGFENVFGEKGSRYPEVSADDLRAKDPQLILLSSEPYPFKEQHIEEFRQICPNAKILTVDGEMFSWYGSRLLQAPGYFTGLIQSLL